MTQNLDQKLLDNDIESLQAIKLEHKTSSNDSASEHESQFSMFKKITIGTFKISITFLMVNLCRNLVLIFLQDESSSAQAAASLGTSIINILGLAVFVGLNSGLMSRMSHSYGAKNYKLMGLYLHRGLILNLGLVIISSVLVYFSPLALSHLGYGQQLAEDMREFIKYAVFSFLGYGLWQAYSSYLNALKIFHVGAYIQVFTSIICICSAYLFITVLGLGLKGAAFALIIQQSLAAFIIIVYCYTKNPAKGTLFKFERDSFRGVWDLFKYQVVAGSQIFFEWIGYEIMILFSGTLNVNQVAGLVLSLNFDSFVFGTAISANITLSSYIGNFMGAKLVSKAKAYLKIALYFMMGYSLLADLVILIFNTQLASLYSNDEVTQLYFQKILKIFMIMIPLDNFQGTLAGVLRSVKREKASAVLILINMYLIALPTAFLLVLLTDLQIYGIVIAIVLMVSLNAIGYLVLILKTDWDKQAIIISEKIGEDDEKLEESKDKSRFESEGIITLQED